MSRNSVDKKTRVSYTGISQGRKIQHSSFKIQKLEDKVRESMFVLHRRNSEFATIRAVLQQITREDLMLRL